MKSAQFHAMMQARTSMVFEQPFFGSLVLRLPLVEDPTCKTGWTDGVRIGFNPAFTTSLSHAERVFLLAHEVMHVAAGHPWRRDGRESKRWNHACDYAINGMLAEAGMKLPADVLLDPQFSGRSAEWIYDRLPAMPDDEDGQGSGSGNGAGDPAGEVRDAPAETGQDPSGEEPGNTPGNDPAAGQDAKPMSQAEWEQAVQQAAGIAKGRGNLPGGIERFATDLAKPKVEWRSLLHRFAQEISRDDYSWSRPNRRYLARGIFLPSLHSRGMGKLAVAVDVSGSVDGVQLAQMEAEINAIAETMEPAAIDVIYCDRRIQKREEFPRGEAVRLRSCGGGGTDFRPVFEALEEDPPVGLVFLTDLDGTFPDQEPEYPVLWAATDPRFRCRVPFGERVDVG